MESGHPGQHVVAHLHTQIHPTPLQREMATVRVQGNGPERCQKGAMPQNLQPQTPMMGYSLLQLNQQMTVVNRNHYFYKIK